MPIDSIDYFLLQRSASSENGPWPWEQYINNKTTTTVAPFTVPPKTPGLSDVTVTVADASWIVVDAYVNVALAGLFLVMGKSGNQIALRYLNETYNTRSGNVIPIGSQVLPGSYTDDAVPSPTLWYKLTGHTLNGITITYNVVSVTSQLVEQGVLNWVIKLGGGTSADDASVLAVATDSAGNVIATGRFKGTIDFGGTSKTSIGSNDDIFLAKYNSDGILLWVKSFGVVVSTGLAVEDRGLAVYVDSNDNIVFSGYFTKAGGTGVTSTITFGGDTFTGVGSRDMFLVKFNSAGTHQWSKQIGSTTNDFGYAVAVDTSGNVILTGRFSETINFGANTITPYAGQGLFVAKYDGSNGTNLWAKRYTSNSINWGFAVDTDNSGNIWIAGTFFGTINFGGGDLTTGGQDAFLAKLDTNGNYLFARQMYSTSSQAFGVSVHKPTGQVVVVGSIARSPEPDFGGGSVVPAGTIGTPLFVAKYSSAGAFIFGRTYGGLGDSADVGFGVDFDTAGNVYVAINAQPSSTVFDSTNFWRGTSNTTPVIVKFDTSSAPNHLWSHKYRATGRSGATAIATSQFIGSASEVKKRVILVGLFNGQISFAPGDSSSGTPAAVDVPPTLNTGFGGIPTLFNGFIASLSQ